MTTIELERTDCGSYCTPDERFWVQRMLDERGDRFVTVELIREQAGLYITPDGHWRVQRGLGPCGGKGWWKILPSKTSPAKFFGRPRYNTEASRLPGRFQVARNYPPDEQ